MGFKSIFINIGRFFRSTFNWVVKNTDVEDFLKAEVKGIILTVVKELNETNLTNSQKFDEAVRRVRASAVTAGYNVKDHVIALGIQLAIAFLKGTVGEP